MKNDQAVGVMKARMGLQLSVEEIKQQLTAIKALVSADGFSAKEKAAFLTRAREIGLPDDIVAEVMDSKTELKLEDVLKGFEKGSTRAKSLLLSAIYISSVDGYSPKEQAAVANAAQILGIDPKLLPSLKYLVDMEVTLTHLRHSLLA